MEEFIIAVMGEVVADIRKWFSDGVVRAANQAEIDGRKYFARHEQRLRDMVLRQIEKGRPDVHQTAREHAELRVELRMLREQVETLREELVELRFRAGVPPRSKPTLAVIDQ